MECNLYFNFLYNFSSKMMNRYIERMNNLQNLSTKNKNLKHEGSTLIRRLMDRIIIGRRNFIFYYFLSWKPSRPIRTFFKEVRYDYRQKSCVLVTLKLKEQRFHDVINFLCSSFKIKIKLAGNYKIFGVFRIGTLLKSGENFSKH